ncbi:protein disulfide isomerase [Pluteus cervinus]|uniref:Protein disulfide isomerase n=1 Tax=Pluteus cervinus TaxID=181527 RepID=A0ACD3AGC7_9AGAR|nr:protein disulfide isomerase [Pluteus cervinus]
MLILLGFLQGLPFSLLVSALFAVALPVQSKQLTPENFKESTAHGLWFIEHFSPYCHHCKEFKPTWDQLVEYTESSGMGITLAQVDCSVHGDLCDANGVKGYPQMTLFKDGQLVEHYKGRRDLDILTAFLTKQVAPFEPPHQESSTPEPEVVAPLVNTDGNVLVLNEENFQATLEAGPAFVKYYAPWCGHCKKLAPTWKQLAKHMQDKLVIAEVDCEDEKGICSSQGIKGYPSLYYYGAAGVMSEYTGGRKLEQLLAFSEKASASGTIAIQGAGELDAKIAEEEVVYLFLHTASDTDITSTLREASHVLLGHPTVYVSSARELFTRYSIPGDAPYALIAFKDHDGTTPVATLYNPKSKKPTKIIFEQWLLQNRIPSTTELTQDTFQGVMNPASAPDALVIPPLVVLATSSSHNAQQVSDRMKDIAKKWKARTGGSGLVPIDGKPSRQVVFAWMDKEKWGDWMKNMYNIQHAPDETDALGDVKVVVVDHSVLLYSDVDLSNGPIKFTSSMSIFSAIEGAASGQIRLKHSENGIERTARFINNKVLSIEGFVKHHPMYSLFIVAGIIVAMVYGFQRLLADEGEREYRKLSRLD